jgi:hypothetical protein
MHAGDDTSFTRRIVRWLAIFSLAHALLRLATYVVFFVADRRWYLLSGATGQWQQRTYLGVSFSMLACQIAAAVAAGALLAWKRWGRTLLIVTALCTIALSLAAMGLWMVTYANSVTAQRAATQPGQPSMAVFLLSWAGDFLDRCFFSLFALVILLMPEVARLWADEARGAFEVLPLARTADAD